MKSLQTLKEMGYKIEAHDKEIRYTAPHFLWSKEEKELILSSLNDMKENKDRVLQYLLLAKESDKKHVISVDVETTGLDPRKGMIRLVAWSDGVRTQSSTNLEEVRELLANEEVVKVFHNASFDVLWLETHGCRVENYTDTLVLSQIVNNKVSQDNSLDLLVFKYLGHQMNKQLQHADNWQGELTEEHFRYCEGDAKMTNLLYDALLQQIEKKGLVEVMKREINTLPAIIQLQQTGIPFHFDSWKVELEKMEKEKQQLAQNIMGVFGLPDLNIKSPKQLKTALESEGIYVESTSDEVLAKFEEQHLVIQQIRLYKKLQKRLSAFGDKLKDKMDEDGRIRGNWRLIGANTGRMSCTKPNLQGLPTVAKKYVVAPEGSTFVVADYSQIELRVIAQLSKDKVMMESYQRKEDLHKKTAAAILGTPIEEVTPEQRAIAKTTNFGLLYGMTAYGLKKRIRAACGLDVSIELAQAFRNGYFQLYQGIRDYQDHLLKTPIIRSVGGRVWSTVDIPLGEIRRLNYPIQATATEGLKEALFLLMKELPSKWKLAAVVHDEIVLEVPQEEGQNAAQLVERVMIQGMNKLIPQVPIEVDVDVRNQWKV